MTSSPATGASPRRAPTLRDVALRAGVSHQTVSRTVNGSPNVDPETRARVDAAIAAVGYRRNLAARTLAMRRSGAIGILAPEVSDYGPTSTVHALERALRTRGYRLLVTTSAPSPGAAEDAFALLLEQAVEAVLTVSPAETLLSATSLRTAGVPIVALQGGPVAGGPTVTIDQSAGARLAVQHLIGLGHRRIEHIAGPAHYPEAAARERAFVAALRAEAIAPGPVIPGDWTARAGYAAATALRPDTTAVFSANDQMALGLIAGLHAGGVVVPRDVSIVGFDDIPEAAFLVPALTTVRQDFAALGATAADLLCEILSGTQPRSAGLTPELVVRGSTARRWV